MAGASSAAHRTGFADAMIYGTGTGSGAPVHRTVRARIGGGGSELLAHGGALAERVTGAERQMEPLFHEHLAEVLLGHACRRLDFWD